jgi:hypothetical protein
MRIELSEIHHNDQDKKTQNFKIVIYVEKGADVNIVFEIPVVSLVVAQPHCEVGSIM